MKIDEFDQQIEALHSGVVALLQRTNSEPMSQQELLRSAFEELHIALEKLKVAEEELLQQNEELESARIEVEAERQRYQDLFEFAPDGYLVTDEAGIIREANCAAATLLKARQQYLVGKPLINYIPHSERRAFRDKLSQLRQIERVQDWEVRLRPRKDISFDAALTVTAVLNPQGKPIALRWLLRDVTERKQAKEQIQRFNTNLERLVLERTAQLQQALDFEAMLKRITDKVRDSLDESQLLHIAMQELVLTLDIICCDTALYDLTDSTSTIRYEYTASSNERTSTTPSSIGRIVQMADFPEGYRQLCRGQYFQFCDITLDPIRSQVAVLSCPIVDDRGVLGDLWLFNHKNKAFDELEIRLVQQVANQCAIAIRQARLYQAATTQVESLEKLNSLKDDFLSTVSHELRTPIANMKMAIQMLKVSSTAERSQRYLEILQAECTRESELINELLDLQRLEAGSYLISLNEAVNLQEMLPTIIEPFHVRTGQRQQTLQIHLPPDLPVLVSNRASLERILAELLNNACKYTPAGAEIVLSVCYKSTEAVTILTISNPAEISADQLPRIFEKFYRVPQGDRWKQGGTGLGLALVQKLVEQLQGIIFVESSKDWTTFTVQLPNQPRV